MQAFAEVPKQMHGKRFRKTLPALWSSSHAAAAETFRRLRRNSSMVLAYQHQANRHRITAGAAAQSQMKPRLRWLQLRLGTGRHKE